MEHEVGYNSGDVINNRVSDVAKKRLMGENRNLWLVLGGLVAIAVVLIVGIVMVNVKKDGEVVGNESIMVGEKTIDCSDINALIDSGEISSCILFTEDQKQGGDVDAMIELYNQQIARMKEEGTLSVAIQLINERTIAVYEFTGDCASSFDLLDSEDLSSFTDGEKSNVYSFAESFSMDCDNAEEYTKWHDLKTNLTFEGESSYGLGG